MAQATCPGGTPELEPFRQILRPLFSDALVERLARTDDDRKGLLRRHGMQASMITRGYAPVGLGVDAGCEVVTANVGRLPVELPLA